MPLEARLLTGLTLALAVAYWATPLAIRVANRFDFHDRPAAAAYKDHGRPTPYLGGAAVMSGFVIAIALLGADDSRTAPLVAGIGLLWVIGTVDDRRNLAWWLRVLVELALAAALWSSGLGWDLGLGGAVDLLVTAFWVVAVVNAFNLFDNMDGQAATIGLVTSLGLAVLGLAVGAAWVAVAGAAMAGACFGFLPHNLFSQPARIFLGDGGSMPLGFAVATVTMVGVGAAAPGWQGLALGLLFVGIPALDTTLVVVSRRRRGISALTGGRDHLTHRARQRLRTALGVAIALGSVQIAFCLLAVAASGASSVVLALAGAGYLVGLAGAVAVIDARLPAVPPPQPAPAPAAASGWARALAAVPAEAPLLILLGVGAGISPWLAGYYGAAVWGPIGLGLIVTVLAVGIGRPVRVGVMAGAALAALAAYGLWGLVSSLWADSIEQAVVSANRTLALCAALALAVLLIRDRRTALWALGAFTATAVVVELVQVVRLLGPDAARHFLNGRLNEPLEYINAEATFSILALWPVVAIAEQRRHAAAAGAGLALAVVLAGLVVLSQSRGAALAIVGSAALVVALVPGRRRRLLALALGGSGLVAAAPALLAVYRNQPTSDGRVHTAIGVLLLAAAACGLIWGLCVRYEQRADAAGRDRLRRRASTALALAATALAVLATLFAGSIRTEIDDQYDAFVNLGVAPSGEQTASRLLSGTGNRYDYWTIALDVFADRPLLGVGAGNYDQPYFRARATTEDVRQPHSLALQSLSELGLVGFGLIAAFFAAVLSAAWRRRGPARADRLERGLLTAAVGTFGGWAVHTQVDWIHLLPGITGGALIAAAVLLRRTPGDADAWRPLAAAPRMVVAGLMLVPLVVGGVALSRQILAQHYHGQARDSLASGAAERAIREADRALRIDTEDLQTYYTKAAAFARLGAADAAEDTLRAATRVEPGDFLPFALLGDLSVRRQRFAEAAAYYREASARNPREPALTELVEDPRAAQP